MKTNRRTFIKGAAAAAGTVAFRASTWAQPVGANSDIRIGVVGFNGRGGGLMSEFQGQKGVRIAALCDVDENVLAAGVRRLADKDQIVEAHKDMRKMFESKGVDAVVIATPNHWHSLAAIWALQAGKDVYVEKPVSHNVWEGRKLVEAARKYNRIVQTGTQSRSNHALREAFAWIKEGNIGKIKVARGLCYKRRASIGKVDGPQPIPPNIDYDLWCGPAPMEPLMRKKLHYDWHWVWPTGNGDLGNQGIHQMDIVRWAIGKQELSPKVMSVGGRLGYIDDGQTPNTQFVVHDYGDVQIIFEVRGLPSGPKPEGGKEEMDRYKGQSIGHVIECEGGYLAGETAYDNDGKVLKKFDGGESHQGNFLKAVRSRKKEDLNAEILEGHLSSALCHTGNISYRLGTEKSQGEIRETIKANAAAVETLARMEEHLGKNNVDLKKTPLRLGVFLEMDGKAETFKNNSRANELLTRDYRKPYVVPEKV